MVQTVEAIFENGVFRPVDAIDVPIREGQRVRLTVKMFPSPEEILRLAAEVYADLSPEEIAEIEQIALAPSHVQN